jgi:hypothetical protein
MRIWHGKPSQQCCKSRPTYCIRVRQNEDVPPTYPGRNGTMRPSGPWSRTCVHMHAEALVIADAYVSSPRGVRHGKLTDLSRWIRDAAHTNLLATWPPSKMEDFIACQRKGAGFDCSGFEGPALAVGRDCLLDRSRGTDNGDRDGSCHRA